jgi:hypothetical protein
VTSFMDGSNHESLFLSNRAYPTGIRPKNRSELTRKMIRKSLFITLHLTFFIKNLKCEVMIHNFLKILSGGFRPIHIENFSENNAGTSNEFWLEFLRFLLGCFTDETHRNDSCLFYILNRISNENVL